MKLSELYCRILDCIDINNIFLLNFNHKNEEEFYELDLNAQF